MTIGFIMNQTVSDELIHFCESTNLTQRPKLCVHARAYFEWRELPEFCIVIEYDEPNEAATRYVFKLCKSWPKKPVIYRFDKAPPGYNERKAEEAAARYNHLHGKQATPKRGYLTPEQIEILKKLGVY
ncbi:MAG: hypothetical protein WC449_05315 [Candidatus Paceibacterota bacterium]